MPMPVREYGGYSPRRSCEREHEVLRLSAAGARGELKQAKGGEEMNETEKRAAEELVLSMKTVPHDAEDYIRGYIQGRLDAARANRKEQPVPA